MKRFYLFVLLTFVSMPLLAKNKISMVTYFPVPYVAYSQVNTTDQMDIGLTSTCDMKLGCSEDSATLNATRVNLKGGKLNLDGGLGIKGYALSLGSGSGEGKISFQNVRIQAGNMESVNAKDIKAANLNLFGKAFPSCKAANGESDGQMQWASLKLKGATANELYLACGETSASSNPEEPVTPPVKQKKVCLTFGSCSSWQVQLYPFSIGGGSCSSFNYDKATFGHAAEGSLASLLEEQGSVFVSCTDNSSCQAPAGVKYSTTVISGRSGEYGMWTAECEDNANVVLIKGQMMNTVLVEEDQLCPSAGQAEACSFPL